MITDFSYFDQFSDMEIDLTSYLQNLSSSKFTYNLSNIQPVKTSIKNIFTKLELINDFKNNIDVIYNYTISENEKPEQVSFTNYNTVDFWWIVFIFNNIKNPFLDWPMSQDQLVQAVDLLYTYEGKYSKTTYYDFLFEQNENKRHIILPKANTISDIVWTFREKLLEYE